jgi:hypothetical protein
MKDIVMNLVPIVCICAVFFMYAQKVFESGIRAQEIKLLQYALAFIRDNGGSTTEEGVSCNGLWCAEQARRAIEQTTSRSGKDRGK